MMSDVIPLWAFLAVTLPLVLTPGASTAVVLRNSLAGGTRAGLETAVGANAGSLLYGLLCAFGFALALRRWPGVWVVLRGAGVVYLAWLGAQSLGRAFNVGAGRRPTEQPRPDDRASSTVNTGLQNIREGFITNVANPALATFYFLILPQFIPVHAPDRLDRAPSHGGAHLARRELARRVGSGGWDARAHARLRPAAPDPRPYSRRCDAGPRHSDARRLIG